jgi:hypothetical protein
MVGFVLENTLTEHGHVARGICTVDAEGYLVRIAERTRVEKHGDGVRYSDGGQTWIEIPAGSTASMNMWGFTPVLIDELEARFPRFLREHQGNLEKAEFFLPEVVGQLIAEGKASVKVLPTDERWFGVTYQEDKAVVKQMMRDLIQRDVYPENLWDTSTGPPASTAG